VYIAIVPTGNPRTVLFAEGTLSFTNHHIPPKIPWTWAIGHSVILPLSNPPLAARQKSTSIRLTNQVA
jgi:hypothetical protein